MLYNTKSRRGVAQFGSALGSGPRGRGFKSRHLDQKNSKEFLFLAVFFATDLNIRAFVFMASALNV